MISAAQFCRDFLTKIVNAVKEVKETNYKLRLFKAVKLNSHQEIDELLKGSKLYNKYSYSNCNM